MSKQEQIDAFLLHQLADQKARPWETDLWVGLIEDGEFEYIPERKSFTMTDYGRQQRRRAQGSAVGEQPNRQVPIGTS
jgi:hypothetical protein